MVKRLSIIVEYVDNQSTFGKRRTSQWKISITTDKWKQFFKYFKNYFKSVTKYVFSYTYGQTFGFVLEGCSNLLGRAGTITTGGNVGAVGWFFLPVNIFTVLCIKSVFWACDGPASVGRFDVDDIEWHLTTNGVLPPDQSLLVELLLAREPNNPAELER